MPRAEAPVGGSGAGWNGWIAAQPLSADSIRIGFVALSVNRQVVCAGDRSPELSESLHVQQPLKPLALPRVTLLCHFWFQPSPETLPPPFESLPRAGGSGGTGRSAIEGRISPQPLHSHVAALSSSSSRDFGESPGEGGGGRGRPRRAALPVSDSQVVAPAKY